MEYRAEFERMMETQTDIALATVVDGLPNVRMVNFYYDTAQKTLYFSTFADNQKVTELEQNPHVAFTTIAKRGEEHVRVKRGGLVKALSPWKISKRSFWQSCQNT